MKTKYLYVVMYKFTDTLWDTGEWHTILEGTKFKVVYSAWFKTLEKIWLRSIVIKNIFKEKI